VRLLLLLVGGSGADASAIAATLGKVSASVTATIVDHSTIAATLGKVSASASATVSSPSAIAATLGKVSASVSQQAPSATIAATLGSVSATASSTSYFELNLLNYLNGLGLTVYPDHIPQGAGLPAVTFTCVSEDPNYTLRSAAGLTARSYQFSAFSTDKLETVAMESALRAALHGYRGFMGSTFVSSCRLVNMLDLPYETNVDASDSGTYHRAAEYRIFLRETIPLFT
jgi:hypothetical protein